MQCYILLENDCKLDFEIQRIDDPEDFMEYNNQIDFKPPKLNDDREAQQIFKSITHAQLESLN